MFTGEFHHTIDEKNRIKFPKALLKAVSLYSNSGLMITKAYNHLCLYILPTNDWIAFLRDVQDKLPPGADKQVVHRFFGSSAMECNIDELGRLLIPQPHKNYAAMKKEVVIVGAIERIELWDKDRWEHYCSLQFEGIGETIQKLDQPKIPEFRLVRGSDKTS